MRMHETLIFPVVLYGCETWSLIVREGHRLQIFQKIDAEENVWAEER
jgi:maleate cis-trans isomerase